MAEIGYCVKERMKREMVEVKQVTMANGVLALRGKCSVCGTSMFRILGKKGAQAPAK